MFNLLPDNIRTMNTEHVDMFKNHLDTFLATIPDEPTMTGLESAADTNSLLHQLPLFYTQNKNQLNFDYKVDSYIEKPWYYACIKNLTIKNKE